MNVLYVRKNELVKLEILNNNSNKNDRHKTMIKI